ncbi:hypothetical protein EV361DRAFT_886364 [Lentinula raphanica]|nr:hypothetical protein EV361DRAFT_886364 [Lentinula raphanica]
MNYYLLSFLQASVELLVAFKLPATCHCCRVQIYPYYSAVGQSVGVEHSVQLSNLVYSLVLSIFHVFGQIWARNMVHEGSSKQPPLKADKINKGSKFLSFLVQSCADNASHDDQSVFNGERRSGEGTKR